MPTRIHLPKDWKRRATRALSNLNEPGVEAACYWCGHEYRIGEYSPETELDHLLQCLEYPKDAKLRVQKHQNAPNVGIVYLVGDKLFIDSTTVNLAGEYGHHLIHEGDHISYWAELVKNGKVPNREYEEFPRGRVAYDTIGAKFRLLADRCILNRKGVVHMILSRMNLPPNDTDTGTDSHYKCAGCLRRSRESENL